jgi:hypothetical protein
MTDEFCVISKSETGAPGTSAPGKNGCKCFSDVRDTVAWISSTEVFQLVVVLGVDDQSVQLRQRHHQGFSPSKQDEGWIFRKLEI